MKSKWTALIAAILSLLGVAGQAWARDAATNDGSTYLVALGFAVLVTTITGAAMGYKGKVVVFSDYNDLAITFLVLISPVVIIPTLMIAHAPETLSVMVALTVEVCLLVRTLARTGRDNGGKVLLTTLAFVTKLTLSILFVYNFIRIFLPSGKDVATRSANRDTYSSSAEIICRLLSITPSQ